MSRTIRIEFNEKAVRMGMFDNLFCVFEDEVCKFAKTVTDDAKWLILKQVRKFYETTRSEYVRDAFPKSDTLQNDEWSKQEWVFPLEVTGEGESVKVHKEIKVRLYRTAVGEYMLLIGTADNDKPSDAGYTDILKETVSW